MRLKVGYIILPFLFGILKIKQLCLTERVSENLDFFVSELKFHRVFYHYNMIGNTGPIIFKEHNVVIIH